MKQFYAPALIIAALVMACQPQTTVTAPMEQPAVTPPPVTGPAFVPFTNSKLRFDGVYHNMAGAVHYYARFYPQGNVTLVNGPDTTGHVLRELLHQNMPSNVDQGIHNVPVQQNGDSLLILTYPRKGQIDYRCYVGSPDSIQVNKYSHVNGKRFLVTYVFEPDQASQK